MHPFSNGSDGHQHRMYGDLGRMSGGEFPSVAAAAGIISNPLSSHGGLGGAAFDPLYFQRAALLAGQHIVPAPASTGYIPPEQFRADAMSRLMTQHNDVTSNFTSVGGQQFITGVYPNRGYSAIQPYLHSNAPLPTISALNTAAGTISAMDLAPSVVAEQQPLQLQGQVPSSQPQSSSQKHSRDSDVDPPQLAKINKRSKAATRVVQRKAPQGEQKIDESQAQENEDPAAAVDDGGKKFIWNPSRDLHLIATTVGEKPWSAFDSVEQGWRRVAARIHAAMPTFKVDNWTGVRNRIKTLIDKRRSDNLSDINRSGTEAVRTAFMSTGFCFRE